MKPGTGNAEPGTPLAAAGGRRIGIESEAVVDMAAEAAAAVKPRHLVILDLRGICAFTDHFLIVSADTERQLRAIADRITERLGAADVPIRHREGYPNGQWILLDYQDVIVHIFTESLRQYYDLERLWADAPRRQMAG